MANEGPQAKWESQGGDLSAVNLADLKKVWQASADFEAHHPGQSGISDTFLPKRLQPRGRHSVRLVSRIDVGGAKRNDARTI
jgi:hypothetical protein